jgi:hypothetical protein
LAVAAVASSACARRIPEPVGVPPGTPHISWIIMYGDSDTPDREYACQSTSPGACVVPASRPNNQVFSDVFIYYHGGEAETSYAGSMRIGFFSGASSAPSIPISVTVKKGQAIANESVAHIVSSTPGAFDMSFDVTATQTPPGTSLPIREQVRVLVQ